MAAGTAAALVPIKSITMRSRNDTFKYQGGGDEPGPACMKILSTVKGIQQGKLEDKLGWCETVKPANRNDYESDTPRTNGVGKDMVDHLP